MPLKLLGMNCVKTVGIADTNLFSNGLFDLLSANRNCAEVQYHGCFSFFEEMR